VSARSKDWKLIFEKLFYEDRTEDFCELFNLARDPDELHNVARENIEVVNKMHKAIDQWLEDIGAESVISRLRQGSPQ
jgi:arylsulfatase A-like enzyme